MLGSHWPITGLDILSQEPTALTTSQSSWDKNNTRKSGKLLLPISMSCVSIPAVVNHLVAARLKYTSELHRVSISETVIREYVFLKTWQEFGGFFGYTVKGYPQNCGARQLRSHEPYKKIYFTHPFYLTLNIASVYYSLPDSFPKLCSKKNFGSNYADCPKSCK